MSPDAEPDRAAGEPALVDLALAEEIELVSRLVIAASQGSGHLADEQIDAALGIEHPDASTP